MLVISWNTAGRSAQVEQQVAALGKHAADIVCLQEVRASTRERLIDGLRGFGLIHAVDSVPLPGDRGAPTGPRVTGEVIASRWPLQTLAGPDIPWPEKAISVVVESPGGEVEVHTVHVPPGSSNGQIKVQTLNGVYGRLARPSRVARLLCGDFNAPQAETADGQIITWGQKNFGGRFVTRGKFREGTGAEWDAGERSVLVGLAQHDLCDVFRQLRGYGVEEFSWFLKRKGQITGRRFDHILASRQLLALECRYLHALREAGYSDHSPISARFAEPS